MTASNEIVVASAVLKDTKRSLDILERIQRIEPSTLGTRVLYTCMRKLGANGVIPEAAVVEKWLREGMENLTNTKRQEGLKALTQAVSLSKPSPDEIEVCVRRLLSAEKKKTLVAATNKIYEAIERDNVDEAEMMMADSMADLSMFDYDNTAVASDVQDYDFFRENKYRGPKIGFGLRRLDTDLGGGGCRKDFWLVAGYAKEGKSTLVLNQAYRAAMRGLNVVFVSLEMPMDEVMCAFYTLHSREFRKNGLPYRVVEDRGGKVATEYQDVLSKTIDDFNTNPKYGKIHVIVPKDDATIITIHQQILQVRRRLPSLDLAIVDYLQNLDPVSSRDPARIQVANTIRSARNIAMRFNNGEGIFFVSPHPVKQESYNLALKEGYYPPTCLRETAEAGAKATAVIWMLCPPDLRSNNKAKVGIALHRNGSTGNQKGYTITAQLDRKYVGNVNEEPPTAAKLAMGA